MKIVGAIYLVYLAVGMWSGASEPIANTQAAGKNSFSRGVLINLINPKAAFFAVAVLVAIFPSNLTALEVALVAMNQLLLEYVFYSAIALSASSVAIGAAYRNVKANIDRCASVLLGCVGLKLLLDER